MAYQIPKQMDEWNAKRALIATTLADFRDEIGEPPADVPNELQKVLEVVHRHLFDPELNVDAVRRWCAIKNKNISSRFRLLVGLGLRDYIEFQRIEAAKRLLRHAHLEIYLIAMSVGYLNPETFFRAFQRHKMACTPQQWRDRELSCRLDAPPTAISEPEGDRS